MLLLVLGVFLARMYAKSEATAKREERQRNIVKSNRI